MNYISYTFVIKSKTLSISIQTAIEILIAELGTVGFESFTENENGVTAYVQKKDWYGDILDDIQLLQSENVEITYDIEEIKQVNWNSEWEKNFESIQIDDLVNIRAPFHKKTNHKYDIIIEPKMSFGTGHHETTHLMIQQLLELNLKGKTVLDMGCGTGILAIFTEKKGTKRIDAIDIDEWCIENTFENIERNNSHDIDVYQGDASFLGFRMYDVIIANINRNILLQDIGTYIKNLNQKGILLLSGFYTEDLPLIEAEANKHSLKLKNKLVKNNWVSAKFVIL